MAKLKVFTDGGSRGNPGKAASAFVVIDENDNTLFTDSAYIGIATNNTAEYKALIMALTWLSTNSTHTDEITVYSDSELMVFQLTGKYRVKDANISILWKEAKKLLATINNPVKFIRVPRASNSIADELVNTCLDAN